MNKNKKSRVHQFKLHLIAFTLIEIILVLSIAMLLVGVAAASLTGVLAGAKINRAEADVQSLKAAVMQYANLNRGIPPSTEQGLDALLKRPTISPHPRNWTQLVDNEKALIDPWGNKYQYRHPGRINPTSFDIFSCGPDGKPNTDDDIGNW
jgi:general secretion pathway protein G